MFNDSAVAARVLLGSGRVRRVVVLDADVHQGDGTAAILANEPRVQTISMHGAKNFPFRKPASDLDIALADEAGDDDYLAALETALAAVSRFAPDPTFWIIGGATIALIAFSKGAFGGGAASIGVPMLSFFIDPLGAAMIVAPLVSAMDMFTLRAFGPSSWSKPDLKVLAPGLLIGLSLGWLLFETVDPRYVGVTIALVSVSFALYWFWKRLRRTVPVPKPTHAGLGVLAGAASGFTTGNAANSGDTGKPTEQQRTTEGNNGPVTANASRRLTP